MADDLEEEGENIGGLEDKFGRRGDCKEVGCEGADDCVTEELGVGVSGLGIEKA